MRPTRGGVRWAAVAILLVTPPWSLAQPPASPPARLVVAKATSPAASFAGRPPGGDAFRVLPENAELSAGDLLVTLPGASLTSTNGAVSLTSLADYDGRSPLPILETALTLNEPKGADLDFTLDRGRADVTNKKADGPAVVRVRFWGQVWTVNLEAPGSRVSLEVCGRWPAGARFKPAAKGTPPAAPVASLLLLVLSGSATADIGGLTLGLKAPPGPALLEWDNVAGARPHPQKLEKLPTWADPTADLSADGKKAAEAVERFRQARAADPARAVATFLASPEPADRRVALITLGATDDIEGLGRELTGAKTPEAWDFGVTVLRHWLGRGPGQDQLLYQGLTSPRYGYSPTHARIIMQLLFGFAPDDLTRPETYEVLIEYLVHDQAVIRNLAAWHLVRVVPQGKAIPFKPNGTKEEFAAAYREWKKLVPTGQLPPPPPEKK